jgi:hypothetical protein
MRLIAVIEDLQNEGWGRLLNEENVHTVEWPRVHRNEAPVCVPSAGKTHATSIGVRQRRDRQAEVVRSATRLAHRELKIGEVLAHVLTLLG